GGAPPRLGVRTSLEDHTSEETTGATIKGFDGDKDGIGDTEAPYGPGDYLPPVKYVNEPPKADFFHYPLRITCMSEISFLDNSTDPDGEIVSRMWDFGDGCNATGIVARHIFTKKGNYTVRLTVKDDGGLEASCEKTITVYNHPPIANFTYSPKEPRVNEMVTFVSNSTDPDSKIVRWEWSFGDGSKGIGENVTHAYAKEGNYTVVLVVYDEEEMDWYLGRASVRPEERLDMQRFTWTFILIAIVAVIIIVYVARA
ncbi:MAG: PKD domain-containing protein, partial [Thermoproteota archaeon]